jgi:hypothetical protein
MTALAWDQVGERLYETGVDHGVLYIPDGSGAYNDGFAWNGLTTVTESPSGAEANPQYADNIKYLNLLSAEEFGGRSKRSRTPTSLRSAMALPSPRRVLRLDSRIESSLVFATVPVLATMSMALIMATSCI